MRSESPVQFWVLLQDGEGVRVRRVPGAPLAAERLGDDLLFRDAHGRLVASYDRSTAKGFEMERTPSMPACIESDPDLLLGFVERAYGALMQARAVDGRDGAIEYALSEAETILWRAGRLTRPGG